jgi:hypothetical protein
VFSSLPLQRDLFVGTLWWMDETDHARKDGAFGSTSRHILRSLSMDEAKALVSSHHF